MTAAGAPSPGGAHDSSGRVRPPGAWHADALSPHPRPPLRGDVEADVAIVGGGLSGLWTAYHLLREEPSLRVVVLERDTVGFGASGRNGGWLQAAAPGDLARWERRDGLAAVRRAQQVLIDAVDEIAAVLRDEGIDARLRLAGTLRIARSTAEEQRLETAKRHAEHWGWPPSGLRLLTGAEATERVGAAGVRAALAQEPCGSVDPARLTFGVAAAAQARGAVIYERSPVVTLMPGGSGHRPRVETDAGSVAAARVVLATEAFTVQLPGFARRYLPLTSTVIATAPLPPGVAAAVGWDGGETVGDARHLFFYAQHTTDGRIVLGGRGAPYRLGHAIDAAGEADAATVARLTSTLAEVWPVAGEVEIEHRWSGALGVPRDWCASCGVDPSTGIGWLGGYAGHGVAATYVLARSLAPLLRGRNDPLGPLPWTGPRGRDWEPEPLRWLATQTLVRTLAHADAREARGRRARLAVLARPFVPAH